MLDCMPEHQLQKCRDHSLVNKVQQKSTKIFETLELCRLSTCRKNRLANAMNQCYELLSNFFSGPLELGEGLSFKVG
jgi:hypothetical protein